MMTAPHLGLCATRAVVSRYGVVEQVTHSHVVINHLRYVDIQAALLARIASHDQPSVVLREVASNVGVGLLLKPVVFYGQVIMTPTILYSFPIILDARPVTFLSIC